VVREVHAKLVVDRALVCRVGIGQDGDDVLELLYECRDLGLGELAGRRLPAELSLQPLAVPFDVGDPGCRDGEVCLSEFPGAWCVSWSRSRSRREETTCRRRSLLSRACFERVGRCVIGGVARRRRSPAAAQEPSLASTPSSS
jgi:hypothetical protein